MAGLRLVLIRHAKSSWADPTRPDHARPLAPRGRRTAPAVARALVAMGWSPDAVLCSDATRARQTWQAMAPELEAPAFALAPALYLGGLAELRAALARLEPAHRTAWAIGHNPGWERAARTLCGYPGPIKTADAIRMQSQAPTWTQALAPGSPWRFEGRLVARAVDPRG